MTFPVVAATTSGGIGTNNTSHTMGMPAGSTINDIIIVCVAFDGAPTITINTGISGSNWNRLGQVSQGTAVTHDVFWKVGEASNLLTLTTSSSEQHTYISYRITGGLSVSGSSSVGTTANSDPANHAPSGGLDDYLWLVTRAGDAQVVASVEPSGYGNMLTQTASAAAGASTNTAYKTLQASSDNPGAWTVAAEDWVCYTISVAPSVPYVPSGSVAAAAGTSTAQAVGAAKTPAVGASTGVSAVSGTGKAFAIATGSSTGQATALAVGYSKVRADFSANGTATGTAAGKAIKSAVFSAAGTSTAQAVALEETKVYAAFSAAGTSTVTGVSNVPVLEIFIRVRLSGYMLTKKTVSGVSQGLKRIRGIIRI